MSEKLNPNLLYDNTSRDFSTSFWGKIPFSFEEAINMIKQDRQPDITQVRKRKVELLKQILIEYHEKLGILTPKVSKHIELINNGSILVGQQPVVMGGPGFIGNKLACLISLFDLAKNEDLHLAPVFFVGDYDGLQKELTRQYFPNPISHSAHIIDSEEYLPEESSVAAHAAKLPPLDWLFDQLQLLEDNFRGLKKQVKGLSRKLLEERWDHIRTLLLSSFTGATTLSEWSVKLWGTVTNIINDFGVVYLPTSHPKVRELIYNQYMRFIKERETYTRVFQNTMNQIDQMGYQTTLPHRHDDYSPFTYECVDDHNRITTTLEFEEERIFARGKCPACEHELSVEITTLDDLKRISTKIGPRVDTSQAVFQDLMNIRLRISGPGEIAYYTIAAPALKAIGFDIPVFIKYKRAFYNTTWNEKLGKILAQRKQGSLHQPEFFELQRERMIAHREKDADKVRKIEDRVQEYIYEQYEKLRQGKQSIDVQKYLGWQYGVFTQHKFGQEVSWVWFDMALQTGLGDYIQAYQRMYLPESRIGTPYFINSLV